MKELFMDSMGLGFAAACVALVLSGCSEQVAEPEEQNLMEQALTAAEGAGFCPHAGGDGGELRVYAWSDYIAPEVVSSFERALGVKVVIDTFSSNEAMFARLCSGNGDVRYDIVMPSSYLIGRMAKEGMVEALDHAKIPNVRKNFDPSFVHQILDPSFRYNVPYTVTYTGLMYAKGKVPAGADVNSWAILGHPAFKGRVTFLDDFREVIGAGLMYLGHSVNSTNPKEIDAAVAQVLKWRGNALRFDGKDYKSDVPEGRTWVGHGYSTDTAQVVLGDVASGTPPHGDIGFALPREGFSIVFDELVILRGARRKDLAYAFINYLYDGDVAAANMNFICGPSPVLPGIEQLDDDFRRLIIPDAETLRRGQVLKRFDDPSALKLYRRAWGKIMAGGEERTR